ncbi:ATP-dependent helicase HrpB [Cellvibrio japonicus]|nr:ATP-dependent helicase HrpB [Cellvibrio japonicus]QEI17819.1 ATP-dependent helicase HrpB [Cellvibrio japonicus]QEI21394.1 ATP-dependent helicase HrpB [Cellvibrio japonicus]
MSALQQTPLLLEAEPGAGKSTLAPLWALAQVAEGRQVILVQPRILAAQALAVRLAQLLGEACGERVGYQVPYDSRVSSRTQLLVATPGVLLQRLLANPELGDVGCVMLDEIHERSVNQDLLWALLQEVQILRDDVQLVVMSATPDPALQQQIHHRLFAPGRCFPVSVHYQPPKALGSGQFSQEEKLPAQLLRALANHGDWQTRCVLVFLPGWREIDDCAMALHDAYPSVQLFRLHSQVAAQEQRNALDPAQGPRVILATNIAETSLTIADVTLVIDSGLARRVDYEQRTGLSRLRTARISMASAEQRRGRAGRVQAGQCIRLWSQDQPLAAADLPEIRATDYLPLALRIAHWGSPAQSLPWLEPPNRLALQFAQQQLQLMGLLDVQGMITDAGRCVSELGTHPRVAALLLNQQQQVARPLLLLALALHFDWPAEQDLVSWLDSAGRERARNRQWQVQCKRWLNVLALVEVERELVAVDALALARAFNDRIGYRQESGRYRVNSGISVQASCDSDWAVFPLISPKAKGHSGIGLPLVLNREQQRQFSQCDTRLEFKQQRWQMGTAWRMGGVLIDEQWQPLPASDIPRALLQQVREHIQQKGWDSLRWPANAQRLLQRARLVASSGLLVLPALDEEYLIANLDDWLLPFLTAQTQLDQLPWQAALEFYLGYDNVQNIAALLPEAIELPSGRRVTVEFSSEGQPQVAAKLQEFFGCEQLQLAQGRIPLKIHLLSPNGSPLAVTANLQTFWQQAYPDVRKEMRGRYPRHPWPENPLEHQATALTKKKLAQQPSTRAN